MLKWHLLNLNPVFQPDFKLELKTSKDGCFLDVEEIMWILDTSKTQNTAWTIHRGKGKMFPSSQFAFFIKDTDEMPVWKCTSVSGFICLFPCR